MIYAMQYDSFRNVYHLIRGRCIAQCIWGKWSIRAEPDAVLLTSIPLSRVSGIVDLFNARGHIQLYGGFGCGGIAPHTLKLGYTDLEYDAPDYAIVDKFIEQHG